MPGTGLKGLPPTTEVSNKKLKSVHWPKINKDRIQWILVSFWTNFRNNLKTKTPYNYSLFLHLAINNTKLMSTFLKYFPSSFFPLLQVAKTLKLLLQYLTSWWGLVTLSVSLQEPGRALGICQDAKQDFCHRTLLKMKLVIETHLGCS